jgi:hypothetical protein
MGLDPVSGFDEITPIGSVRSRLEAAYESVDDIDPWVGLLAEPHAPGAMVGETLLVILRDQFLRLRDGDRFWYQDYLPPHMAAMIEEQTLARIIRRNTTIGDELPDDVFRVAPCPADFNADGLLDILDVLAFVEAVAAQDPAADLNTDGVVDLQDIQLFVQGFNAGCP